MPHTMIMGSTSWTIPEDWDESHRVLVEVWQGRNLERVMNIKPGDPLPKPGSIVHITWKPKVSLTLE
jgi:hypothetical protein